MVIMSKRRGSNVHKRYIKSISKIQKKDDRYKA